MGNKHYIDKSRKLCLQNSYESSKYVSGVAQPFRESGDEDKNMYERDWFELVEANFED